MERTASASVHWPEALARFVQLFNAGRFWHAHEVLEDVWRRNRSGFYHGLIVYASAFVHAQRGNPRGVVLQLKKVPHYLGAYPDAYLGLSVASILRHAGETVKTVQAAGMPEGESLRRLIDWPALHLDPSLCSGTEPELADAGPESFPRS